MSIDTLAELAVSLGLLLGVTPISLFLTTIGFRGSTRLLFLLLFLRAVLISATAWLNLD